MFRQGCTQSNADGTFTPVFFSRIAHIWFTVKRDPGLSDPLTNHLAVLLARCETSMGRFGRFGRVVAEAVVMVRKSRNHTV